MKQVRLGDIDVAYVQQGEGDPVVLLHGLADDHRFWFEGDGPPEGYQSFAVDLRGHGQTSLGRAAGSFEQLAGDLAQFVEHVVGQPAICVGFSGGGVITMFAALAYPELVRAGILAATTARVGRRAAERFAARADAIAAGNREQVLDELRVVTEGSVVRHPERIDGVWQRRIAAFGDGGGYANACRAMSALGDGGIVDQLPKIRLPAYIIGGTEDAGCPPHAMQELVDAIPTSNAEFIDRAGHLLTVDAPDETAAALARGLEWCRHLLAP